ncbi:hypothetical protein ACWDR0_31575 [Streptomyces sp. NPDC003691]
MESLGGGVGVGFKVPLPCSHGGVGEAVGDEQGGCPAVGEGAQAGEELMFGTGVERAGRSVEDDDGAVAVEAADDAR